MSSFANTNPSASSSNVSIMDEPQDKTEKYIKLISEDQMVFYVPLKICQVSKYIVDLLEISCEEELPTIDLIKISGKVLIEIIKFMENFIREPFEQITAPLPKEGLATILNPYCLELVSFPMVNSDITILKLLEAEQFLNIPCLRNLLTAKIADSVRNKNTSKIFDLFGITPNQIDLKKIKENQKNYPYIFESSK